MMNTGTIFRAFIVTTMLSITLIGCSNDEESLPAPENQTTGNTWDQMEWDKGTWAN